LGAGSQHRGMDPKVAPGEIPGSPFGGKWPLGRAPSSEGFSRRIWANPGGNCVLKALLFWGLARRRKFPPGRVPEKKGCPVQGAPRGRSIGTMGKTLLGRTNCWIRYPPLFGFGLGFVPRIRLDICRGPFSRVSVFALQAGTPGNRCASFPMAFPAKDLKYKKIEGGKIKGANA